ncbi:GNAT family N-acetyltransferase [Roseibium sp. RKSG952]|uniref:GNAT family N-acetyltransferase n=1 Tax=Roseibium sp. RKSG952 TaxID=2529384 RepID=UPI0012BD54C3|nr:N-acetyltransferase [Roseibium sp. RKSG952]MTH95587.1 N-acetyltransferase [Roseibium sp. RKSG952]
MNQAEISSIVEVHRLAFGKAEGDDIAQLARDFLDQADTISISAKRDGKIAGNVMFTPFVFRDHPETKCYLLAPCGVSPEYQGRGVGKELMETSIEHLRSIGADAVFVLGVPTFYPRYEFAPTDKETPYPDLLTVAEAWMVLELSAGSVQKLSGKTTAIPPIMHAHCWDTSKHG